MDGDLCHCSMTNNNMGDTKDDNVDDVVVDDRRR